MQRYRKGADLNGSLIACRHNFKSDLLGCGQSGSDFHFKLYGITRFKVERLSRDRYIDPIGIIGIDHIQDYARDIGLPRILKVDRYDLGGIPRHIQLNQLRVHIKTDDFKGGVRFHSRDRDMCRPDGIFSRLGGQRVEYIAIVPFGVRIQNSLTGESPVGNRHHNAGIRHRVASFSRCDDTGDSHRFTTEIDIFVRRGCDIIKGFRHRCPEVANKSGAGSAGIFRPATFRNQGRKIDGIRRVQRYGTTDDEIRCAIRENNNRRTCSCTLGKDISIQVFEVNINIPGIDGKRGGSLVDECQRKVPGISLGQRFIIDLQRRDRLPLNAGFDIRIEFH